MEYRMHRASKFDKTNLGENITAVYFDMYIVFILSMHELDQFKC